MDAEATRKLLGVGLLLRRSTLGWQNYPIKAFHVERNHSYLRVRNTKTYDRSLVAQLSKDEGWFWVAGRRVRYLFF